MKKDQLTEISISLTKSIFSVIPFAGGALNEIAFDFRSRLKQERLNRFIELLSDFFTGHPEIDPETLKTEEFSDLFESVIKRVLSTKSNEKHKLFRDVLTDHIQNPGKDTDSAEIYLDLISTLDEMAISILKAHFVYLDYYEQIHPIEEELHRTLASQGTLLNELRKEPQKNATQIAALNLLYIENQGKYETTKQDLLDNQLFRKSDFFYLTDDEYLYYKQTLYAKGLLVDKGLGMHNGGIAFLYMWITEYGRRFLKFINQDI